MRKIKNGISSIIIFSLLLGILTTTAADAADFFGVWSGQMIRYGGSGSAYIALSINLTQSGATVGGTATMTNTYCGTLPNWPVTGTISGDTISFTTTGFCSQAPNEVVIFEFSGILDTINQLAGSYSYYCNGSLNGWGTFNVTRQIINPSGYNISASAGTGGGIIPAGNILVNAGANQTFNISPNNGYSIVDVQVDGASVGAINSYTFSAVSVNHTIMATFKIRPKSMPWLFLLLDD